jgi:hypothetical protein
MKGNAVFDDELDGGMDCWGNDCWKDHAPVGKCIAVIRKIKLKTIFGDIEYDVLILFGTVVPWFCLIDCIIVVSCYDRKKEVESFVKYNNKCSNTMWIVEIYTALLCFLSITTMTNWLFQDFPFSCSLGLSCQSKWMMMTASASKEKRNAEQQPMKKWDDSMTDDGDAVNFTMKRALSCHKPRQNYHRYTAET